MKKFTGALAFVILLFAFSASPAFAHTHLDTSDPEEGSTVTEPLDSITLYFETVIEESAVMELHAEDGTEVALDNLTVNDDEFSADVTEPLENGTYTISWDIIGVDGHPMEDSISFEVDIEETAVEEEENTDAAEDTENAEDGSEEQADENEAASENNVQEEAADDTNSNTLLIAVLVIAIVAVIAIVLLKRKK
ncbi:copper resistance CopC family protein [Oceanobacillus jeddahense]|uniref:copper resistance CopC family protein n=1 Tax=Oceanobacillus jeddahense TaxID=1462527 RepID=UPI000595CF6E|nr:copper resistance CopC family protein [Oceanobacillus jeddahense]